MTIKLIKFNVKSMLLSVAAFVVAASGFAVLGAHSANAAVLSTDCPSAGYSYVGSYPIYMYKGATPYARTGTLGVYYKSSTGKNCAQAKCSGEWCFQMYRTVKIKPSGKSTWDGIDAGNYNLYAGGVTTNTSTAGRCIDIYARFSVQGDPVGDVFGEVARNGKFCG